MKLLKQKSSEYNGKSYYKYWTVIASKFIDQLEWKKGDKLEARIEGNELKIRKKEDCY